ncbi:MAG: YitT family protein [Bacilli bacterium]|nr:YitT family protein [Bacilli bacterium]
MNLFSKNKDLLLIEYVKKKSIIKRLIQFLIGCFLVSVSYNLFIAPNNLVPGGVGGLAIIFNNLFGMANSTFILIANILLLILCFFLLGKEKTSASFLGSILLPTFIKLTEDLNVWLQIDSSHLLLSAAFGGIIYGFGAGLVFRAGFTNGGTDIINHIITKYAKVSLGKSMLMSDGLIVLASGIFFGLNSMIYSIIILYIISLISDRVVLGISDSKFFYIITEKEDEVREFIIKYLGHGVTIFKAKGGYKKETENVLMTVIPTKDYFRLKNGINEIDEEAFFIITDTYQVFGGE